jgi:hypothetical protein
VPQNDPNRLPIHPRQQGEPADGDQPSCSPKIYVSNEEASLLGELRALRERALALRRRLTAEANPAQRRELEAELEQLRTHRDGLVRRREAAFRRKMIMLGHLPQSALDE